MERLGERVALITGGASGIGRATARRLAQEGAAVMLSDIAADDIEATAAAIRAGGGAAVARVADLSRAGDRTGLVPEAIERFGRVDILVNNAAVHGRTVPFLETGEEDWREAMDVNFVAAAVLARDAARDMLTRGRGAIVNVASIQPRLPLPRHAAYVFSKGALEALTRVLAVELSPRGVRVNAVAPAGIDTTTTQAELGSVQMGPSERGTPPSAALLGRAGTPEEVAAAVAYLASDDASFVTGTTLYVDGGRTVSRLPDRYDAGFRGYRMSVERTGS